LILYQPTVNIGDEVVEKLRKRPSRETHLNRGHVRQVWGNDWDIRINILVIVDDYNTMIGATVGNIYQLLI
jgi:hypothetical protein